MLPSLSQSISCCMSYSPRRTVTLKIKDFMTFEKTYTILQESCSEQIHEILITTKDPQVMKKCDRLDLRGLWYHRRAKSINYLLSSDKCFMLWF